MKIQLQIKKLIKVMAALLVIILSVWIFSFLIHLQPLDPSWVAFAWGITSLIIFMATLTYGVALLLLAIENL